MKGLKIRRHNTSAIIMHWFNAICWLFLVISGIGLINNSTLQPFGMAWPARMNTIFGSAENLLIAHVSCGITWSVVFMLFGLIRFKRVTMPFIREIFDLSLKNDLRWLLAKGGQMTLGRSILMKFGLDAEIPDQGFYNAGQKLFAIPAMIGSIIISLSGMVMVLSAFNLIGPGFAQWSILIHFISAGFVFAGLLIHIFMASLAEGELPALISMFTGDVPEEYAKHHHRYWYDQVKRQL